MESKFLQDLNPMQQKAVLHTEGPLLILAGAGSGKTRALTHRIAYLIELGVPPFRILAITFTNKAANEMKERVRSMTERGGEVAVSTFHSLCVRILRREIHHLQFGNNFTIYDADDSESLVRACLKELNLNDRQFPVKSVTPVISRWKDELVTVSEARKQSRDDARQTVMADIYAMYQRRLVENNALDFDDIIMRTIELFTAMPEVLAKYQDRFKYIMVDEYQDTNTSQYRLISLLSKGHGNLCVVGDDDQSIYGWRGANIRNILEFEKDFAAADSHMGPEPPAGPGAGCGPEHPVGPEHSAPVAVIRLEQNYRSTQTILDAANAVIANNVGRKQKLLWTDKGVGEKIEVNIAALDLQEAGYIADKISKSVAGGRKYSEHAVLYRSNAQSRLLEDALLNANIPYRLFGGVRFYDRKEIKDLLAYLRAVNNNLDSISLTRIINVPKRGIGGTTIARLREYAELSAKPLFDVLRETENIPDLNIRAKKITEFTAMIDEFAEYARGHNVMELLEHIISATGYLEELKAGKEPDSQDRAENVGELVSKTAEFVERSPSPTLETFLEDAALVTDLDRDSGRDDAVSLMTLHSAKGLEFPFVFIAGMEEGLFPTYRSMNSGAPADLEEERRLCYVGITRAKEKLCLSGAQARRRFNETVYNAPSQFLREIPAELIFDLHRRTRSERVLTVKSLENLKTPERSLVRAELPEPKNKPLDFAAGDTVEHKKYGAGVVRDIRPAGADYEVAVEFPGGGVRKFMAHLAGLTRVQRDTE
ncbi:MAG: UvrD-helicase domain-containing protein [Clostridiales bacterium]|jgi:DNA helicase-2/ATP-dependent DNA helicase PcrA|nr:UvrD-helicase domain-containing protein [Clostridiales bacterium]